MVESRIQKVRENKKQFHDLLLLADEQEDVPSILSFYKSCGFTESHRIKNFLTDNYEHPMFEGDIKLVDMVYLKKELFYRN